ncbi:MAG: hypothetical protein BAJALOKI3v1_1050010 [Promethearchaeota archaeon]|nr:MAG: hypothetical protein BAJALOKI3v1_1050010 [Candidatus Lokiarchaeota archaeon]
MLSLAYYRKILFILSGIKNPIYPSRTAIVMKKRALSNIDISLKKISNILPVKKSIPANNKNLPCNRTLGSSDLNVCITNHPADAKKNPEGDR